MTDEHKDLIQREIDGLNSTGESTALEHLLSTNTAARQVFDELSIVHSAFESLPELDPPVTLRASIMDALPEMGYRASPEPTSDSIWSSIQQLILKPRPVSLAYAFSIGLLVSFMAWNIASSPTDQIDPALVGTIASNGSPVVYEQAISGDQDLGQIYATVRNGQIRVEVRWTDDSPASLRIAYNSDELYAIGVESVMGESSLESVTRSGSELLYNVARASIDITSLVAVPGTAPDQVSVVDVWISTEGVPSIQHRIVVNGMN